MPRRTHDLRSVSLDLWAGEFVAVTGPETMRRVVGHGAPLDSGGARGGSVRLADELVGARVAPYPAGNRACRSVTRRGARLEEMKARHDFLAALQSAYCVKDSLQEWLDGLTSGASTLLPEQYGAVGRILDARQGTTMGDYAIHVDDPRVHDAYETHRLRSAHRLDFLLSTNGPRGTRQTLSSADRDAYLQQLVQRFTRAGVHDMLHVTAHDGNDLWVSLGLITRRPLATPWSGRLWQVASRRFESALRVQTRALALARSSSDDTGSPCLETPAPAPSVVERLRGAARAVDMGERGPASSDERAREVWRGLVHGSWSCIDRHEAAGRRYVIAMPHARPSRDGRALTPREALVAAFASDGRSEKWIGYTLGVSRSTVANQLAAALGKLALPSHVALTRAFRASHPAPGGGGAALELMPARRLRAHDLAPDVAVLAFDLDTASSREPVGALAALTPAQQRAVELALTGLGDRDIAERLGLSRYTVSNQLRRAYARLGVGTRIELGVLLRERTA